MTDAPQPRPRGRPRKPDSPSSAERTRRWRAGARRADVMLTAPAAEALDALRAASGGTVSDVVCNALLRAADALGGPA